MEHTGLAELDVTSLSSLPPLQFKKTANLTKQQYKLNALNLPAVTAKGTPLHESHIQLPIYNSLHKFLGTISARSTCTDIDTKCDKPSSSIHLKKKKKKIRDFE
jgi:hypothetical protein